MNRFEIIFRYLSKVVIVVLFLLLISVIPSCKQLPKKSDIPIIRRPNWWNYYQRGIAYSLNSKWENAADDFEIALGIKKGAIYSEFNEKRRAKTYGLHFLKDYFPHRELGICYFHEGMYEEAEKELSLSIEMLPSSRAKLYLNKTRQAQFSRVEKQPTNPIQIHVNMGSDVLFTNKPFVHLIGDITSPYRVSQLSINGKAVFIELAEKHYDLKKKVALSHGKQRISIKAFDLAGNQREWYRDVIVDLKGPSLSFSPSPEDPENLVKIIIIDDVALDSVTIDGKTINVPKQKQIYEHRLNLKPNRKIKIEAIDGGKNRTILESNTGNLLKASIQSQKHHPDRRLASASIEAENLTARFPKTKTRKNWKSDLHSTFSTTTNFDLASANPVPQKIPDTMPPRLRVYPSVINRTMVTTEFYVLDVEVMDSGYIDSVTFTLNNQHETRQLRDYKFVKHRFTQTLELQPHENKLKVTARDWAGDEKEIEFIIERKMDFTWREDLRITAQVLPPDKSKLESLRTMDLYSMFLQALLRTPRRLNIVERNSEAMKRLMMELKLSESQLADQLRAVKTGKLTPSDWLLQGYISQWSGNENWDFVINLVDVTSSEYVLTTDIHFTGFSLDHIEFQLSALVEKLNQQLPTLSAPVSETITKAVKIPLGKQHNILDHMRFIFISGEEGDIDFADPKLFRDHWIQGKVKVLKNNTCLVEIYPEEAIDHLSTNDWAILR